MSIWKKKDSDFETGLEGIGIMADSNVIVRDAAPIPSFPPAAPVLPAQSADAVHSAAAREAQLDAKLADRFGKTQSALGPGTVVQGKLSFDTTVRIDGKLSGEINSSKSVIVGRTGEIDAEVEVATLIVVGKVRGNVRATERVEILAGGEVHGSLSAPVLLVEEGSLLDGSVSMTPPKKEEKTVSITGGSSKDVKKKPLEEGVVSGPAF